MLRCQSPVLGGFGSGCYSRMGGAPKCEHHRCIDLGDLRRWGMLNPGVLNPGVLRVIAFGREKPDHLWVLANADSTGVTFIKRRPDSALGKLFVSFSYTETAFGGQHPWFSCPGCRQRCRRLYGANTMRCRECLGLLDSWHRCSGCAGRPLGDRARHDPLPFRRPSYLMVWYLSAQ
jgi:hypothetical protein